MTPAADPAAGCGSHASLIALTDPQAPEKGGSELGAADPGRHGRVP